MGKLDGISGSKITAKTGSNRVAEWKKRFRRGKSPLYLIESAPLDVVEWKKNPPDGMKYHVVWEEVHKQGHKVVKAGWLEDGMRCVNGVKTYCTLQGETPFDFQFGSCQPENFDILRRVYEGEL